MSDAIGYKRRQKEDCGKGCATVATARDSHGISLRRGNRTEKCRMSSETNDDIRKIVDKYATVATAEDSQGFLRRKDNKSENYLTVVNIRFLFNNNDV